MVEPVTYRAQVPPTALATALDGSNYRSRVAASSLLSFTTSTKAPARYHFVKTPVDDYPKDDPEVNYRRWRQFIASRRR